ncbi:MAG: hypothetical protein R3C05_14150 [Pirellulaceae bacterium]
MAAISRTPSIDLAVAFPNETFGGWPGVLLLMAATICWFAGSTARRSLIDTSIWLLLAAPIIAEALTRGIERIAWSGWSIMLVLWSIATVMATVVAKVSPSGSRRESVVPVVGSGLLIATGWISSHFVVRQPEIFLSTWIIGILVGLAITLERGDRRGMRCLGVIPIVSGVFWVFAVSPTFWHPLLHSTNRGVEINVVIAWLMATAILWRWRFIALKRSLPSAEESIRFQLDSILIWIGTFLLACVTPFHASMFLRHGIAAFETFGFEAAMLLMIGIVGAAASLLRWDSRGQLSVGYMLVACLSLMGVAIVVGWRQPHSPLFLPVAGLTLALITALSAWLWPLHRYPQRMLRARGIGWKEGSESAMRRELSLWFVVTLLISVLASSIWVVSDTEPVERWLWISAIFACAWSIAEISSRSASNVLRTLAVVACCIGVLFGSVANVRQIELGEVRHLAQWMRLFIAAVWLIPLLVWVAPKVLKLEPSRWSVPLRRSAILAASTAVVAIIAIFATEFTLRTAKIGIPQIPILLVWATSALIAVFSLLAIGVAMFPGKFFAASAERLSVGQRQMLVYGAQVLMYLAVANKFLCRPSILGLREYWPYIVMAFAFVSAALSAWAKRREDDVLWQPMRNSAFYLPLIPIVGFWLTGAGEGWLFEGGEVHYNLILVVAAGFYLALSLLWPGDRMPRIAGIVAANAALWVTLAQNPGWGFLQHPQLWLIPPAVCVLIAVHLERDRLRPQLVTACRYGATLMIYISSTADMIVQEIGTTLYGPIVLIALAFAGVFFGVILRVRAFLYLGTGFIVIGLTSMVWHAGRAIDQVWPWWAFGITTGLLLLVGLMAVEKNKDALRAFSARLSQWDA